MSGSDPSEIVTGADPILHSFPDVPIPVGDVMKRLGYPSARYELADGMRVILDETLRTAAGLMELRTAYRILRVRSNDGGCVRFDGSDFRIESRLVAKLLRDARYAACIAATAGIALDRAVSSEMDRGEITHGYFLDAIGSETVEAAADALHWKILQALADKHRLKVTPRFSPGYGDWKLTIQKELVETSGGNRIGISVTPSSLMIPRKSISAVLGLELLSLPVKS
jgi:hypothetical protein